ncbi:MAG: hypothetical protein OCC46_07100 [Pseudodesulfovibrio sp.]
MDVGALSGGAQGMGAAANAQNTAQASDNNAQEAKAAAVDNAQQESSKPQIPGVGEKVNITV